MSKFFSSKGIKKATLQAGSLSQKQRGVVQEALGKVRSGGINRQELKRTMRELRSSHQISAIDRKAIEQAMFEDKK
ncbi:hypothetical protein HY477_00550 [Candidatus Uhrbacteria bacterium]|nr:hypothetical protein [Candidatus Uhrbacteria bacterium]